MRLYLDYILSIRRPSRTAVRPQPRTGFTLPELLMATLIMSIAALVAGNGMITMMKNNYKANADSDLRNGLNRSLEFMGHEVKRAHKIASSPDQILLNDRIPNGVTPILAFQLADPSDPTRTISEQVVYYVQESENNWNSSGNRPVLWRYGPPFDPEGNYRDLEDTGKWQITPMMYDLAEINDPSKLDCDPFREGVLNGWTDIWERFPSPESSTTPVAYACVQRGGGNQVLLFANTELPLATGSSSFESGTKISPNSTESSFFIARSGGPDPVPEPVLPDPPVPPSPDPDPDPDPARVEDKIRIVTNQEANISLDVLRNDKPCDGSCSFRTVTSGSVEDRFHSISQGPITVAANTDIILLAGSMQSIYGTTRNQKVSVYTKDNPPPSSINFTRPLTSNELIVSLVNQRGSRRGETYVFLVNIDPAK